jgi:hypothetical protein
MAWGVEAGPCLGDGPTNTPSILKIDMSSASEAFPNRSEGGACPRMGNIAMGRPLTHREVIS